MKRALLLIQGSLDQQAQPQSYVDDFRYLALLGVCCVPLAFLMKKTKSSGGAPAG
jgi:hypothetical protein